MLIALLAIAFGIALVKMDLDLSWLLASQEANSRRNSAGLDWSGCRSWRRFVWSDRAGTFSSRRIDFGAALDATGRDSICVDATGLREGEAAGYALAVAGVIAYTVVLIALTFWLARRAILGGGKRKRRRATAPASSARAENYAGWEIPLVSPALSAIVEKELRYVMRNAQVRMMAFMPLILIVIRLMNRRHFDQAGAGGGSESGGRLLHLRRRVDGDERHALCLPDSFRTILQSVCF